MSTDIRRMLAAMPGDLEHLDPRMLFLSNVCKIKVTYLHEQM